MTTSTDLIGKRFGRLIVEERLSNDKFRRSVWMCVCDCGNTVEVPGVCLRSGESSSCGCYGKEQRKKSRFNNIEGFRFGNLLVRNLISEEGDSTWECLCDCGNKCEVKSNSLLTGNTKSCGCLKGESVIEDITGKIFERWTVLNRDTSKKGEGTFWMCKCECGKIRSISAGSLKSGASKSCGCLQKEIVGNNSRKEYKLSSYNRIYGDYKRGAKNRGKIFELEEEEFKLLISSNCHYCGIEPLQIKRYVKSNGYYVYNGIDRVDNNKGYISGNCVSCCKICNKAKATMTRGEFLQWIERVYKHSILIQ